MRRSEKIRTTCPRKWPSAHEFVGPSLSAPFSPDEGFRPLSRTEVEREITKIDLSRNGMLGVRAEGLAKDLPGDGRDLLHEAICRALTSRQCRETATIDQFLRGIMRSIASTARRSRERRGEHHVGYPVEDLVERMALGGYVAQSAEDIIETERVRQLMCRCTRATCCRIGNSSCTDRRHWSRFAGSGSRRLSYYFIIGARHGAQRTQT